MIEKNEIRLEHCKKHAEWYSHKCSNCMAETVEHDVAEEIFGEMSCWTVKLNEKTIEVDRYQWTRFFETSRVKYLKEKPNE